MHWAKLFVYRVPLRMICVHFPYFSSSVDLVKHVFLALCLSRYPYRIHVLPVSFNLMASKLLSWERNAGVSPSSPVIIH